MISRTELLQTIADPQTWVLFLEMCVQQDDLVCLEDQLSQLIQEASGSLLRLAQLRRTQVLNHLKSVQARVNPSHHMVRSQLVGEGSKSSPMTATARMGFMFQSRAVEPVQRHVPRTETHLPMFPDTQDSVFVSGQEGAMYFPTIDFAWGGD
ncbi:MAG: hypothetical protein U0Z75_02550 [Deinococcaceae bacterium]